MEILKHIGIAHHDKRGRIRNVFEGELGHVAIITSKRGSIRGNHYHNKDRQYIYLVEGSYESHSCDVKNPNKRQLLRVKPGDIVETPPMIAHAQKFTKDSIFLALSTRQREGGKYESDTVAFEVVRGYMNRELKK